MRFNVPQSFRPLRDYDIGHTRGFRQGFKYGLALGGLLTLIVWRVFA